MPLVDDFFIQFNRLRFSWSFFQLHLIKQRDRFACVNKQAQCIDTVCYQKHITYDLEANTNLYKQNDCANLETDISNWLNQFYGMDNRNRAIWRIRIVIAMFVFDNAAQLKELQRKTKTKMWIIHATITRNQPNGIIIHLHWWDAKERMSLDTFCA